MIVLTLPIYLRGNFENRAIKKAIEHYSKLGYPLHLCGSEGRLSYEYCEPYLSDLVRYFEVPQEKFCTSSAGDAYLRRKFNESLQTHSIADWYCLMGSDDLVSPDAFAALNKSDIPTMGGVSMKNNLYIVDLNNNKEWSVRLRYREKIKLLPGLNAFNYAAMEACDWEPYQLSGCETGAEKLFADIGKIKELPGFVVMVKESDVLNSISHIRRSHRMRPVNMWGHLHIKSVL